MSGITSSPKKPASTIPGCRCRECKHRSVLYSGRRPICGHEDAPCYLEATPEGFGCTLGELLGGRTR